MTDPTATNEPAPPPLAAIRAAGAPKLTFAMIAALALVFAAEHLFAVAPWTGSLAPDNLTLLALGAMHRAAFADGEWFRLWTAATLHADIVHLLCNIVALSLGGIVLEGLLGRAWLLALFMLGALGGSLTSYFLNPGNVLAVGASGAILGLLTAAVVGSFRLPRGPDRTQLQTSLAQFSVPALIPMFTGVDYAAHLGGALTGGALGLLLLFSWPRSEPLPRFRGLARIFGVAGLLVLAYGFIRLAAAHDRYVAVANARGLIARMIPEAELPRTDLDAIARSMDLVARWPDDPRARMANAMRLVNAGDLATAESDLRHALAQDQVLTTFFPDRLLESAIRAQLVEVLRAANQPDAAREAAAPACTAGPNGAVPEPLRRLDVCP